MTAFLLPVKRQHSPTLGLASSLPLILLLLATPASPVWAEVELALEEVTVIGRRDQLGLGEASASSEIVSFADQASLNRTVGDWIEQVPGVSLNGQGGLLQAYSIRGFSRWRVRTELDGVPIITDRRAGNSASFVPPELIDDIRVEKAASSTLYGSGAMGGVVALSTPRVSGTRVSAEARSNDNQYALTAMAGDSDSLAGGFSIRRADQAEAPGGEVLNTGFEQLAGFVQGVVRTDALEVRYSWLPSVGRDIGKSNTLFPDERISDYPRDTHSLARVEMRSNDGWLLRGYHHYQDWSADVLRLEQRRNLTEYRAHTVGGLFHASSDVLSGKGSWGVEWIGRRGVSIKDSEFAPDDTLVIKQPVLEGEEDNLGAFFDQRWALDSLIVNMGVRLDHVRQSESGRTDSDNQWSGSIGASYAVAGGLSLNAELASGYRFPSLSERYFDGVTPRGEVRGAPDLRPETRTNLELGLRYSAPAGFSLGLTSYYSDLEDYIERYDVSDELISYRNLEGASIRGAELDMRLATGAVSHRLSYQWQRGDDDDGNELADLNPPSWRYFASWQRDSGTLISDLSYRERRSEFGAGELPLDEAWIWNARWSRRLADGWEGQLFFNNILDEPYVASADDLAPLQPGRVVGLRISWRQG